MIADPYTPTTDEVREAYANYNSALDPGPFGPEARAEFDRWLDGIVGERRRIAEMFGVANGGATIADWQSRAEVLRSEFRNLQK